MYRASQIQADRSKGAFDQVPDSYGMSYMTPIDDIDMNVDDINMSGQFSPPHETENTMMGEGDAEADADSPYADQISASSGMLSDEPKYEIDDFSNKAAYNIDLFQGEGEEKKVNVG